MMHHRWVLPDGTPSNACEIFLSRWSAAASAAGLVCDHLGTVDGHALELFGHPQCAGKGVRLLITAGFHGEEPAGPWGLLQWLQTQGGDWQQRFAGRADIRLIPLVNATGFQMGRRFNDRGENPNRGFNLAIDPTRPSAEGALLIQHASLLREASRDGVLSCHEDIAADAAYVYTLESQAQPSARSQALVATLERYLPRHEDGLVDHCPVHDGIVFNQLDGSFEAWLFREGARYGACLETPGRQAIATRIAAQAGMTESFVQSALEI